MPDKLEDARQTRAPHMADGSGLRWRLVIAAGGVPFIALLILFVFDIPIGQPFFLIHRYSSLELVRALRALPALAIGLAGLALLYRSIGENGPHLSRPVLAGVLACWMGLVAWTFAGPPSFVQQHAFNMLSPSHEGAFVLEARHVETVRAYLSHDFYERLKKTPEEMRGRRVLSNPPGMTVAALAAVRAIESSPSLRLAVISGFGLSELDDAEQETEFAAALLLGLGLTLAWGLSILPAYWLCRLWLPQIAAMAVALAMVFGPATATFTPGKDPAQLLTVLLILWGWLGAYIRRQPGYGVAAGAAFVLGMIIGLIHVWIIAIVATATLGHAVKRARLRDWLLCCSLPSVAAAAVLTVFIAFTLDWNLLRSTAAVAARYGEIQLPIITDPFYWTLVGLPMFLLFVGSLFWVQCVALRPGVVMPLRHGADAVGQTFADESALLGRWLVWVVIAVMAYSYFFANNSETPRLWIPFIPPLLLGMAMRRSAFREDSPEARRLMLLLLTLQVAVTLAFWSLMDVRESEWRLLTGRLWD